MEMQLCKHEIQKSSGVFRGYAVDTYIKFCRVCGEPVIRNVAELAAFISKPRKLAFGNVKPMVLNTFDKVDFILANWRLLRTSPLRKRGRPPVKGQEDDFFAYFFYPKSEADLPVMGDVGDDAEQEGLASRVAPFEPMQGFGRMPGRMFVRVLQWNRRFYDKLTVMLSDLLTVSRGVACKIEDEKRLGALVMCEALITILAKGGLKLKMQEIKELYAAGLISLGASTVKVCKTLHVGYRKVGKWLKCLNAALKKTHLYPEVANWPHVYTLKIKMSIGGYVEKVEPSIFVGDRVPDWVVYNPKTRILSIQKRGETYETIGQIEYAAETLAELAAVQQGKP